MYKEPWSDISEYPEGHKLALEKELATEVGSDHILSNKILSVIAKREDCDDILLSSENNYFVVHLTWSGKIEESPWPKTKKYESLELLEIRLAEDAESY